LRTSLDALAVGKKAHIPVAPVMIYGDDGTHVVTEEGIAYLYKAEGLEERFHARDGLPSLVPETWPPPRRRNRAAQGGDHNYPEGD